VAASRAGATDRDAISRFLSPTSAAANSERVRGFRQGLKEQGYMEGENVAVVYRWADYQLETLRELETELLSRHISVLAAVGSKLVV
jgi:putative ABC transport system substrate-binding protein